MPASAGRCRGRAGARSRRSAPLGGAESAGARVRVVQCPWPGWLKAPGDRQHNAIAETRRKPSATPKSGIAHRAHRRLSAGTPPWSGESQPCCLPRDAGPRARQRRLTGRARRCPPTRPQSSSEGYEYHRIGPSVVRRQVTMTHHNQGRLLRASAVLVIATLIVGALIVGTTRLGGSTETPGAVLSEPYAPFRMTYITYDASGESITVELTWLSQLSWDAEVVAATEFPRQVGSYNKYHQGVMTSYARSSTSSGRSPPTMAATASLRSPRRGSFRERSQPGMDGNRSGATPMATTAFSARSGRARSDTTRSTGATSNRARDGGCPHAGLSAHHRRQGAHMRAPGRCGPAAIPVTHGSHRSTATTAATSAA